MQRFATAVIVAVLTLQIAQTPAGAQSDAALVARARAIHNRVIKLDTHNDIDPRNFTAECNYTMRLTTQINLPKGPLTPAGYDNAYNQAIAKFDAIHRLTENIAPDKIGLALSPADVVALHKKGVRIAVIGVENGYPIGNDIKRVKEFYDRGGRYMSLAHNGNNQLADSNTGEKDGYSYNNGLSPLGRQVIAEMNRLGMMVDLSHPSKGANLEAIRLSKAPVIASHTAVRALGNVSRNMNDEQLLALKANGGVVQINGVASFIKPDPPERAAAQVNTTRRDTAYVCPLEDSKNPPPSPATGRATVKDFVNHIDYAVKLIGIDHVGIASDFDGGGGVEGWNSAADAFNVTLELVRRGYTEQQIGKLWSGNLLRVWSDVEKVATKLN
jgi:membrane dipeptidase